MSEEVKDYLRRIQFEKCKGELRALVLKFNFMPTYDGVNLDSDSQEKDRIYDECEKAVEEFIKYMEDNFIG